MFNKIKKADLIVRLFFALRSISKVRLIIPERDIQRSPGQRPRNYSTTMRRSL